MTSAQSPYPYYNGIAYNSAFFTTSGTGLTVSQANAKYLQKTIPDTATALETFQAGVSTDLIQSYGGFGGTIYTDPGVGTQTYSTLVCQNNSTCSFGGSAGTCNLGGLSTGVNIGYNMPTGNTITIGTAPVQDTNILIATKGAIVTGTNKIQIGASANTLNISSGTVVLGTANCAISIGAYSLQTNNILIGTKGAIVTGTDKIVIGGATNTLNLSSGTINLNSPLTPTYLPSSLSLFTQVGFVYKPTVTWTTFGDAIICTQTNIDAGVYMVSWNIQTTGAFINNFLYIFGLTTPTDSSRWAFAPTGISNINVCSGSTVISSSATFNFIMKNWAPNTQGGGSGTTMQVWITRIA